MPPLFLMQDGPVSVSNYPNENKIHLGIANSHLQHTLSDSSPIIRLDPSSTLGFAKPRQVDLRFN